MEIYPSEAFTQAEICPDSLDVEWIYLLNNTAVKNTAESHFPGDHRLEKRHNTYSLFACDLCLHA